MKKSKADIEKEVLKTMQSLDGLEPAKTKPFFYTRLEAKLDKEQSQKRGVLAFLFEPQLALSAVALLLLITVNIVSVNTYLQSEEDTSTGTELTTGYDDYLMDVPVLYTENGE